MLFRSLIQFCGIATNSHTFWHTKKKRKTAYVLHLLSGVLRKPLRKDIVITQSHAIA